MGIENCGKDRIIDRDEHRAIERRLNEHSRFWCKMLRSGVNHDHEERIMKSKLCNSENAAPKYYLFKDHKVEGGFRPVVGGCNSDTLGLSNTLSDVIESVANAVIDPFEVVSSEDMLSRVAGCNQKLKEMKTQRGQDWDWTDEYILIGTDVQSLFPSLSAERTGLAVREQFEKSIINWENIDWKYISLYISLQEKYWKNGEIDSVRKFLPVRKSDIGRPPSIGTENLAK